MQRSIAAKYAARSTAQFVRPSSRARERRLGLRSTTTFRPVTTRETVLWRADLSPLQHLRASWRSIQPAQSRRRPSGSVRPPVAMRWSRPGVAREGRTSAASAPWLA